MLKFEIICASELVEYDIYSLHCLLHIFTPDGSIFLIVNDADLLYPDLQKYPLKIMSITESFPDLLNQNI